MLCTSDPLTIDHVLKKWRNFVKSDNVNGEYDQEGDMVWRLQDLIGNHRDLKYFRSKRRYGM